MAKRYGELIMSVEGVGRWYWAPALQVINYVKWGDRHSSLEYALTSPENTHTRAVYHAARLTQKGLP